MDPYESEEWDFDDINIYDVLLLEDLPAFLEDLGYKTRKIGTSYLSRGYYKHIFHFTLCHYYDDYNIFKNDIGEREYIPYNSLLIDENVNITNTARFIVDLFKMVNGTLCMFIDILSKDPNRKVGHTTLLIYRKDMNKIEYFDSNGVAGYGYSDKLKEIINIVMSVIPGITLVRSRELNGLEKYSIPEANARSLNARCGISSPKSVGGWCQMWSLLLYELIRKYPREDTKNIIQVIYKLFENKNYVDASTLLNNLMKGFYRIIIGRTNIILRDLTEKGVKWTRNLRYTVTPTNSKSRSNSPLVVEGKVQSNDSIEVSHKYSIDIQNIYIRSEVLQDYQPKNVLNDSVLEEIINESMEPYCLLDGSLYEMNN